MKILCIGEEWRGSNASGLFYALSRNGALVQVVNEQKYVSTAASGFKAKSANKLIRPLQIADYNQQLRLAFDAFKPALVLVYKGTFVDSSSVLYWKSKGIPVVNFFPDVSFLAHGGLIPACIPHYDHIFTTKTFAAGDLKQNFGYDTTQVTFIPHGFDLQVHRPVAVAANAGFQCEASFIGNYSRHKNTYLTHLVNSLKPQLKVWGASWERASESLKPFIQGTSVSGDLYALAINASVINIALLSEQVVGASSGDQITSRTFHIPGAGGFMLHQRSDEVQHYFTEDEEMVCFGSEEELKDKVSYYLRHEQQREQIRQRGHQRAMKSHSLDQRAIQLLEIIRKKFAIR